MKYISTGDWKSCPPYFHEVVRLYDPGNWHMRQFYKFFFISERYQSPDIKQKPFKRVDRVLDVFPLKY